MKVKYRLSVFILLTVITAVLAAIPASAQSCTIRTDWPIYTVARGDTLFRIATRFHTTTTALAAANCISNTSLIFVGQVLRVPSGSGGGVTNAVDIPVTFQQYEKGVMIYRSDNGDIWVYVGQSSGSAMRFLSATYGRLPDNPVYDPTPTGRVRSIMGFGRVWGNYPNVRAALGWATNPERSYTMRYAPVSSTTFYFSLPDGHTALTSNNRTWSLSNGPIPTPAPPTPVPPTPNPNGTGNVRVSYQPFEHGFMIWRSDGGLISVYQNQTGVGGLVSYFPANSYAALPDNPVFGVPPGKVRPILGFGKVWGNFDWVRTALGWGIGGEMVYTASFSASSSSPSTYFNLPDGRIVFISLNQYWSYRNNPLPPSPTSTPIPPTTTVTVNAAYQLFENGFLLWRADTGRIDEFNKNYVAGYNLDQYQFLPDNPVTDQPPAGRFKPINGFGRVWGNFPATRSALGWGLATEQGYQATFKTDSATNVMCVNLPDGHFVSYPHYVGNRSWTWQYENSCG